MHARTGTRLFRVERWQCTKALLCCSSRDSQEDREFYQAKTVKTHSNNLVVLAHVQLKPFYRLSTRDVTHVRKCTRPSPALPYCKRREARRGPWNEATDYAMPLLSCARLCNNSNGACLPSCCYFGASCLIKQHALRHKWVGVLSRERHPLQQLHLKKGGGRIFEGGLIFGDYGN